MVLTGTETEERLEDLLIKFDEMSFYPATLCPNAEEYAREWKRKLIYAIGQLRKETAEKIFHDIKISMLSLDMEQERPISQYRFSHFDILKMARAVCEKQGAVIVKNDEICKEITEGKDDAESKRD